MKKTWAVMGTAVAVSAMIFTGCGSSNTTTGTDTTQESENTDTAATDTPAAEDSKGGDFSGLISPISREEGSGTRGAFIELFGIETKDTDGNKIDNTTDTAEITNSTSVMMTTVAGNEYAIGYVSLGSLDDSAKALKIDGAEASVDTVKDGSYKISRPFNIVTKDGLSEVAADFVKYIMSEDGQKVVEDNGYISQGNEGAYEASGLSGKVTVAGSSSVTPVMEKLAESYKKLNADVEIEVQQNDSTTGVTSAIDGICDIGMASRELKDTETSQGVTATPIALDGIAVIVNKQNPVDELTSDQVMSIFTGETQDWADVQ